MQGKRGNASFLRKEEEDLETKRTGTWFSILIKNLLGSISITQKVARKKQILQLSYCEDEKTTSKTVGPLRRRWERPWTSRRNGTVKDKASSG